MAAIKTVLKRYNVWITGFTVLAIIAETIFSNSFFDLATLFLLLLLVLSIWAAGIKGKISLWLALALLIVSVLLVIWNRAIVAEKIATWSYFLFIIGGAQMFLEELHAKMKVKVIKKIPFWPLLVILLSVFLFSPALGNFFSGDDWFHLNLVQIQNPQQFFNFFSFSQTAQSAAFYRPISTQLFFFIFQTLFGLNPLPYYLFVLIVFGFSLYLVYLLGKRISGDEHLALWALFFYAFSATNFTRIYFLSAFQEIVMIVFVLLSLLFYLKSESMRNILLSCLFFVFALGSKETAIVLPFILLLLQWFNKKTNFRRLLPFGIILGFYLFFRFFHFGGPVGESYLWDFSPKRAANTLFWYALWSLGAPELLVDYVSSGLRVLPRFYSDFPVWSFVILSSVLSTVGGLVWLLVRNIKKIDRLLIFTGVFFLLGLVPVLFLPWHKFSLELALPMVGFSLFLAGLSRKGKTAAKIFIFLYLGLNVLMNVFTYKTHYSVNRAKMAREVFDYFRTNFPDYKGENFFFINNGEVKVKEWGMSKQIAHSSGGDNLFQVLYGDKSVKVFFEDLIDKKLPEKNIIKVNTEIFLP
jgi:hypothetical protein